MKRIDLTGKKFGRWTVLNYAGTRVYGLQQCRFAYWNCRCKCGNERIISTNSLKKGTTQSCGCKRNLPHGEANFNSLFGSYKKSARRRKLSFELTSRQFRNRVTQKCRYCGHPPLQIYNEKRSNGVFFYNGIDRLDNDKGYTARNSVPCCNICNNAKKNLPVKEFENWLNRIVQFRLVV